MLNSFLFIGVGGSGGKTLWTLKADLEQRLKEVGYEGEWPTCWQLLHIDVPTTADGADQDLPDQLEEKDYIGLVPRGVNYRSIDDSLISGDRSPGALWSLCPEVPASTGLSAGPSRSPGWTTLPRRSGTPCRHCRVRRSSQIWLRSVGRSVHQ